MKNQRDRLQKTPAFEIRNTKYEIRTMFFGSSTYCIPIIQALQNYTDLAAVITQPYSLVIPHASSVHTPANKEELIALAKELKAFAPDIAVVADYGMIIPEEIFTIPRLKTLNIHFSKLPQYRGASPVQYTILSGDTSAWMTIMRMDATLDTGDILWQKEVHLTGTETTQSLYTQLFIAVAQELPSVITAYAEGNITPHPQRTVGISYTRKLTRDDGFIPFDLLQYALNGENPPTEKLQSWPLHQSILPNLPASPARLAAKRAGGQLSTMLERALRAFTPWPGIWTEIDIGNREKGLGNSAKRRLKILKGHIEETRFVPDQVQLEGKKPVTWKQFSTAYQLSLS